MNRSDLVQLRGGDYSTSHSFLTFREVAMKIDVVKAKRREVYAMFQKDVSQLFNRILACYSNSLFALDDDNERHNFADHLESLVSFEKFCKEKANEI